MSYKFAHRAIMDKMHIARKLIGMTTESLKDFLGEAFLQYDCNGGKVLVFELPSLLTVIINDGVVENCEGVEERRRFIRVTPDRPTVMIMRHRTTDYRGDLLDISLTGVAFRTSINGLPQPGEQILVRTYVYLDDDCPLPIELPATIVRSEKKPGGTMVACTFTDAAGADPCYEYIKDFIRLRHVAMLLERECSVRSQST